MRGENNLIPFSKRTKEEQRKMASAGGKASGEARRKKADLKRVLNLLLTTEVNNPDWEPWLKEIGVQCTPEAAMTAAIIKEAMHGNVQAYRAIRETLGQDRTELDISEQETRIRKMEAEINSILPVSEEVAYRGIPADMIAPIFAPVLFDIAEQRHSEYVFPGGRGSTKSSFISEAIIDLIKKNDSIHAVVLRQVADTLRGSVYQQILWAISALRVEDDFQCTVSPLEVTRISTGQKIYFRGADDPGKIKSIKVPFGHVGIVWFEELDQFYGEEAVRKIEQSAIRGGEVAYKFKSFNPPKSANNWANMYIKIPREDRLVTHSTYLDVPPKWLGKPFLADAEFLKEINPAAYENEYLGVANGVGGNVFDNVIIREITDEDIAGFDRIYRGVDWGWYPDPFAYVAMYYDSARMTLYIFDEYSCNKQSNAQTAEVLKQRGCTATTTVICDSAEKKSVSDYCEFGIGARAAYKPPGSVEYGMKWLQSLREIVIDNKRCPGAAEEFLKYEYNRDKEGNVITGYPDKNNHRIDAVRYGLEDVIRNVRVI